jgi:hypothetical protein
VFGQQWHVTRGQEKAEREVDTALLFCPSSADVHCARAGTEYNYFFKKQKK